MHFWVRFKFKQQLNAVHACFNLLVVHCSSSVNVQRNVSMMLQRGVHSSRDDHDISLRSLTFQVQYFRATAAKVTRNGRVLSGNSAAHYATNDR